MTAPRSACQSVKKPLPIGGRPYMTKRSQLFARRQDDLFPANQGQPPQRAAQYWTCHRRGQKKVATKTPFATGSPRKR